MIFGKPMLGAEVSIAVRTFEWKNNFYAAVLTFSRCVQLPEGV